MDCHALGVRGSLVDDSGPSNGVVSSPKSPSSVKIINDAVDWVSGLWFCSHYFASEGGQGFTRIEFRIL